MSESNQLSELTIGELQTLKEKLGLKVFKQKFGLLDTQEKKPEKKPQGKKRKADKDMPVEVSSKVRLRPQSKIPSTQRQIRDPRFDETCGTFREEIFTRDYGFVSELKAKEKQKVQKELKKVKNAKKKQKLKEVLNKMKQEEQTKKAKEVKKKVIQEWTEKEKELVKDGKKPYFLKKSDIHMLELAEKFKELKKSGDVQKHMEKIRKRRMSKLRAKGRTDVATH